MIQTEQLTINGKSFTRTYSDAGYMIHGGYPEADYVEAVDPANLGRTYVETDTPIEGSVTSDEILDILLGGEDQ